MTSKNNGQFVASQSTHYFKASFDTSLGFKAGLQAFFGHKGLLLSAAMCFHHSVLDRRYKCAPNEAVTHNTSVVRENWLS